MKEQRLQYHDTRREMREKGIKGKLRVNYRSDAYIHTYVQAQPTE